MTLPSILTLAEKRVDTTIHLVASRRWSSLSTLLENRIRFDFMQPSWTTPKGIQPDPLWKVLRQCLHLSKLSPSTVVSFRPDLRDHLLALIIGRHGRRIGPQSPWGFLFDKTISAKVGSCHEVLRCFDLLSPLGISRPTAPEFIHVFRSFPPRIRGRDRSVALHPGAASMRKRWPLDSFIRLSQSLCQAERMKVVVLLGPDDREAQALFTSGEEARNLHVVHPTSILDLATELARVDLLVCNDSGPMHLAEAVGTPVVALFGPTNEAVVGPLLPESAVVPTSCPHRPCWLPGSPPPPCAPEDCFSSLQVDHVLGTVHERLSSLSSPKTA